MRIQDDSVYVYNWPADALSQGFASGLMSRLMLTSRH